MWNEIVERHPGLPGLAFSSYVSLWARLPEIQLREIVNSFEETAELIRVPAMRNSVITSTPQMYERIYPAFRLNLQKAYSARLRGLGVDPGLLQIARDEITQIIGEDDLTVQDVARRLQRLKDMPTNVLTAILHALCADRVLVRARVRGALTNPRTTYALWDNWVPAVLPNRSDFHAAVLELATWYFDAYPGATVEDFCWWGGWDEVQLHRMQEELEYSRLASSATPLRETWEGWHLLPPLDALTMAYRSPRPWLPPDLADRVFDASGNATSVIIEDGVAVGIWDLVQIEDVLYEMRVAFFDPNRRVSFELEQQVTLLGRFLGLEIGDVVQVRQMYSLKEAGPNAFRAPLRDAIVE